MKSKLLLISIVCITFNTDKASIWPNFAQNKGMQVIIMEFWQVLKCFQTILQAAV